MEIRMLRARVREISDMRRVRMLDFPYSRDHDVAFNEQYNDMLKECNVDDGHSSSGCCGSSSDTLKKSGVEKL